VPGLQAGLPGNTKTEHRHIGGPLELREPEQRVTFDHGQPRKGRAVL
jgi:hypothetical protein